jgi:hypothetical protein
MSKLITGNSLFTKRGAWKAILPPLALILSVISCQIINTENSKCKTPTLSPAAGTYTAVQSVAISTTTEGAAIHYTTDGTTPTASSTLYSGPISVAQSMTIQALASKTDMTDSDVVTAAYVINLPSTTKALTAFAFASPSATGTVDESAHTVAVTVPFGTTVTALVATFTTTGASVTVGGVAQVSGITANNFTSPVTYKVTAADGSSQDYVVTVTVVPNSAKAITTFSFASPAATGIITESTHSIAITVPYLTPVGALVATFSTTGISVSVNGVVQTSGVTANNFASTVTYTVTAADTTTQAYAVTVTVALNPAKDMTSFGFSSPARTGTITGNSISVTVPFFTELMILTANFGTTGVSVTVDGTAQTSGSSSNNFTNPVVYRITAADNSYKDYTVTVTREPIVWTSYKTANGLPSNQVNDVFIAGSTIYLATGAGVAVSSNGGTTWTVYTTSHGLPTNSITSICYSGSTIYVGTNGSGAAKSSTPGVGWTRYYSGNVSTTPAFNDFITGITTIDGSIYVSTHGGISKGTSDGASWTTVTSGLGDSWCNSVHVGGSMVFAGTLGGVSYSANYGSSYTNYTSGLGSAAVNSVYYNGSGYAATENGLSISRTSIDTWVNYTTANGLGHNMVLDACANDFRSIVIAAIGNSASGGISISVDGGYSYTTDRSWGSAGAYAVNAVFLNGTRLYAATASSGLIIGE